MRREGQIHIVIIHIRSNRFAIAMRASRVYFNRLILELLEILKYYQGSHFTKVAILDRLGRRGL